MSATAPTPPLDRFYRFYGSEVSYFTGKVRPALRYKRVPFAEILSTPRVMKDVIRTRTGLAFIPIVVTPEDDTWQDTSEILDALEARYPQPALYPSTPVQRVAAYLLELYADEFLVLPALHYRWNFPESVEKARADFAATTGDRELSGKFADRMAGATQMMGIVADTIPAIEAHARELFECLDAHFAQHPYLLGGKPSLADCALMGPLYAHFYLDAAPGKLIRAIAPRVCNWIERMNHPDPDERGDWLADDELPATLRPILTLAGRDAFPIALDNVRDFERWADETPRTSDEPPRGVNMHTTSLRGAMTTRFTSSYTSWMVQRPLDAYLALTDGDRAKVDAALQATACDELLRFRIKHRLGKRAFKLVFA